MKECQDIKAITRRLKCIEGQVRGLIRMVEEDKGCEETLIQISSVKAALHSAGQMILENHLQHCVIDGIRDGNEAETIKKLNSAIKHFSRIT
ncbi:MAG: metal-sensing transcriptional repressor [Actinomycetia bacterium]|nr:metal-sensing transcriptional repressor [Actinomycetes bacterium]